ncbi:MAG: VOC family protein [Myxococcales bacterium]|nr:VOC family protein [Myxococcales bacterium]
MIPAVTGSTEAPVASGGRRATRRRLVSKDTRALSDAASDSSTEPSCLLLAPFGPYPAGVPVEHVSHLGLCVADLDRSLAFYRDALGFRERHRLAVPGDRAAPLLGLDAPALHAVYLERDGLRLELLRFDTVPPQDLGSPRPMNGLGLTHLSLRVSQLDAVLAKVTACGGHVLEDTRIGAGEMAALFVLDPDGTRLELVQSPGDPSRLPGEPG